MVPVGAKVRGNVVPVVGAAVGTKVGMVVSGSRGGASGVVESVVVEFVSVSSGRNMVGFEAVVVEDGVGAVVDAEMNVGGRGVETVTVGVGATAGSVGGVNVSTTSRFTSLCEDFPPSRNASDTATPIKHVADKKNNVEIKTNNLSHKGDRCTQ